MRLNKLIIFSLLVSMGAFSFVGCRKKKDTSAEITVLNNAGTAVANAKVELYPTGSQPGSTIDQSVFFEAITGSNGKARFSFNDVYQLGQAGVLVLNIKATSGSDIGEGIIKIEEEVENTETVYI